MNEEFEPQLGKSFGLIPWSVTIALVLNLATGVWFASGMDQRMRHVEDKQLDFARDVGRLDQAREATNLHMTQLDDQFKEIDRKLGAILDIMKDPGSPEDTAPSNGGPPSFPKPPARR